MPAPDTADTQAALAATREEAEAAAAATVTRVAEIQDACQAKVQSLRQAFEARPSPKGLCPYVTAWQGQMVVSIVSLLRDTCSPDTMQSQLMEAAGSASAGPTLPSQTGEDPGSLSLERSADHAQLAALKVRVRELETAGESAKAELSTSAQARMAAALIIICNIE